MAKDAEVFVLQKRLKATGFYKGKVDGDFGPATLAAALEGLKSHPVIEVEVVPLKFNYQLVREKFGPLAQGQVDGFETILKKWAESGLSDLRYLAYMLATTWHETSRTMKPITEYGSSAYLHSKPYWPYIGRGYVQLTWRHNYAHYGIANNPEKALDPDLAAHIMIDGMVKGIFTGRKLADYFNAKEDDPVNARRIINGTDRAHLVASYHRVFLDALMS